MARSKGRFIWLGEEGIDPVLAQIGVGAAIVAALLTLIGQIVFSSVGSIPPSTGDMLKALNANQLDRLAYGGAVGGGASVAMLFLWPVLYRIMRNGAPTWALLGLILACAGSALTIVGFGATQWVVPLGRAVRDGGLDLKVAGAIGDSLTGISGGIVQSSFVVLGAGFASFSIAFLRTRLFPREFSWFAAALAIILVMQAVLPRAAMLFELVGVVWFLWLGLILTRAAAPETDGAPERGRPGRATT